MIEQETDCEGHQKLHVIALMTVFKLETDCPSQGLACVVGGFVCERAYEWRGRKGKGKERGSQTKPPVTQAMLRDTPCSKSV